MRRHVPGSAIASPAGYRMQLGKCDLSGKLKGKKSFVSCSVLSASRMPAVQGSKEGKSGLVKELSIC